MIIGVPPSSLNSDKTTLNNKDTVHKITITPCIINPIDAKSISNEKETIDKMLKIFSLISLKEVSIGQFKGVLQKSIPGKIMKYVNQYLNDNKIEVYANISGSIVDTFSNMYQEHFFKKLMGTFSQIPILGKIVGGARSFARSMGIGQAQSLEYLKELSKGLGSVVDEIKNYNAEGTPENEKEKQVQEKTNKALERIKQFFMSDHTASSHYNVTWKELAAAVLTNDLDFPQVWAGSSFNMSGDIKITLYNPFPASDEAYYKYILAPISILSVLASPKSGLTEENMSTVFIGSPFYLKMEAPGLLYNPFGAISSLTINKGGDNGAIAPNNRMIVATINISFKWLFSALVSNSNSKYSSLKYYLETLSKKDEEKKAIESQSTAMNDKKQQMDQQYNKQEPNTFNETMSPNYSNLSFKDQKSRYNEDINLHDTTFWDPFKFNSPEYQEQQNNPLSGLPNTPGAV